MAKPDSKLISTWILYHNSDTKDDKLFWAWNEVTDAVQKEPNRGFELIRRLIDASPNDRVLGNVGAGPLETLITEHCASFIELVEETAQIDAKFRRCLTAVWCEGDIPDHYYRRIEALTREVEDPL